MSDDDESEVPPPPPAHPHPDSVQQTAAPAAPSSLPVSSPLSEHAEIGRGVRSRRQSRAEEHARIMAIAVAQAAAQAEEEAAAAVGRGSMSLPTPAASDAVAGAVSHPLHAPRSRSGSLSARPHSRRASLGDTLMPPMHSTADPNASPIAVAAPAPVSAAPADVNGAASIAAFSPITSPASCRSVESDRTHSAYEHSSLHSSSPSPEAPASPPVVHHHGLGGHSFHGSGAGGMLRHQLDVLSPLSSNSSHHLRSPSQSRSSHSQSRSQTRLTRGMSDWISAHSPFSPVSSHRGAHMGFGAGAASSSLASGASFGGLPPPPLLSASDASAQVHTSAASSSSALVAPAPSKPASSFSLFTPGASTGESIVEKLLSPLTEFFQRVTTPRGTPPPLLPPTATAAAPAATTELAASLSASSPLAQQRTNRGAPTTITTSAAAIQESGQRKRSDTQSDASPDSAELRRINPATRTRSPTAASLAASSAASASAASSDPSTFETRDSAESLSSGHFTFSPPSVPRKVSVIPLHGVPEATETELFHCSFQTKSRTRSATAAQADNSNNGTEHTNDSRASVSAYSLITPSKILSEEEEEAAAAGPIAEEDEDEEEEGFGTPAAPQPDFSGISSEQAAVATDAGTLSSSKSSALAASVSSAAASSDDAAAAAPFDIDTLLSDDEFSFFDSLAGYGFPDDSPLRFAWLASYSSVIQSQELAWEAAMDSDERVKALTEKQYKALTRQGIPAHFRAKIWWSWLAPETLLGTTPVGSVPLPAATTASASSSSSSSSSPQPTLLTAYQSYLRAPCDEEVYRNIVKDVDRTFTTHPLFRDPTGPGCRSLRNVLVAFANRNNNIGYCQSLNFLAAWFLIFYGGGSATAMATIPATTTVPAGGADSAAASAATAAAASASPAAPETAGSTDSIAASSTLSPDPGVAACSRAEPLAFWMLCALVEKFLPPRYFDSTMLGVAGDVAILLELVRLRLPKLWSHLGRLECQSLEGIVTSWFLCGFLKTVPVETALRIWDCMFVEGSKVLFRVGLALIAEHERDLMEMDDFGSAFNFFNQLGSRQYDCDRLLKRAFELKSIKRGWIETQRKKQQAILTKRFDEMEARRQSIEAAHALTMSPLG